MRRAPAQPQPRAHARHRLDRDLARLGGAAREDGVDARRIGAQLVAARADAREVRLHALEQHLLAVDAADAGGRAAACTSFCRCSSEKNLCSV